MAIISHNDIRADGLRIFYGTAPPQLSTDGTYYGGETLVAIGSVAGQPFGWRCVSGGTPGNWIEIGQSTEPLSFGPYNGSSVSFAVPLDATYVVQAVYLCFGSSAGSGTLMVERDTGSSAVGSGVAQLASTISLMSTSNVTYAGVMIGSPSIFSGGLDRLGVVMAPAATMGGLSGLYVNVVLGRVI